MRWWGARAADPIQIQIPDPKIPRPQAWHSELLSVFSAVLPDAATSVEGGRADADSERKLLRRLRSAAQLEAMLERCCAADGGAAAALPDLSFREAQPAGGPALLAAEKGKKGRKAGGKGKGKGKGKGAAGGRGKGKGKGKENGREESEEEDGDGGEESEDEAEPEPEDEAEPEPEKGPDDDAPAPASEFMRSDTCDALHFSRSRAANRAADMANGRAPHQLLRKKRQAQPIERTWEYRPHFYPPRARTITRGQVPRRASWRRGAICRR